MGLVIFYLYNIEKGKKYFKMDKIFVLFKVLEVDYNYLVFLEVNKKLKLIIDFLYFDFFKIFLLDDFGIDVFKFIELFLVVLDKVNVFVSIVFKIICNFDMQGEDFYKVVLCFYQDLYDNYFEEVEEVVNQF